MRQPTQIRITDPVLIARVTRVACGRRSKNIKGTFEQLLNEHLIVLEIEGDPVSAALHHMAKPAHLPARFGSPGGSPGQAQASVPISGAPQAKRRV